MPKNVPGFELLPGLPEAMQPKRNSLDGWWDRPFSDPEANLAKLKKKKHIIIFRLIQIKHGI